MNSDDQVIVSVSSNAENNALMLEILVKKDIIIQELQGDRSLIEAIGGRMPKGYKEITFDYGGEVPEEMAAEVEFMNKRNFRWGCNNAIAAGSKHRIEIPAKNLNSRTGVMTLVYQYSKLFGLLKKKTSIYVLLEDQ